MDNFFDQWNASLSGHIWGLPEGVDAFALKYLFDHHENQSIFIAVDDAAMDRMRSSLLLLGVPEEQILVFPAWDCLPYDRISPNGVITGQRLRCLSELTSNPNSPKYILTTINAWLQLVPPPEYFHGSSLSIKSGQELQQRDFINFVSSNAYQRCETVREPGEFAVRGGIIDVFPPGFKDPVRIDFFDIEVDTIKIFDAETQRSKEKIKELTLIPVSEIMLNEDVIGLFRTRYLEHFGASASKDPLYVSISEGRNHPGMEIMLPLFHSHLVPFGSYAPHAPILVDPDVPAALVQRVEQINDFFQSRSELGEEDENIWRPLSPSYLYQIENVFDQNTRLMHLSSRFSKQDGEKGDGFDLQGRRGAIFHNASADIKLSKDENDLSESPSAVAAKTIAEIVKDNVVILAASTEGSRTRMDELIADHLPSRIGISPIQKLNDLKKGEVYSVSWPIEDGFSLPGLTVITEKDIYGTKIARPQGKRRRGENFLREVSSLTTGDLVVHVDHGIGRYEGLEKINTGGVDHDCLLLIYQGGDKLFLPVENIDLLSRFGKEGGDANLDKLGGSSWQARKAKVKGRIKDIADQLIKIAALRETAKAEPIVPDPGPFAEFCQRFPYAETEDQLDTIDDVLTDLSSGRVMDRLVCGDVGFGKTEVAMRAAFTVAMAGFQVAVVTPTTLLARQHGKSFTERFKGFPIEVGVLSRMTSSSDAKRIRENIASGDCQIAIGTHALLSKSINFNNLGLVVVDEEQNFGVTQKEKLKSMRGDIHVLTLSATPIPRTLQMSLSGVRDMSIIATPPVDRLAVRTSVGPWDPVVLAEAIRRERFRGGQVFCVCPRIDHLERVYERLLKIVPESRIITAHGQMPASDLDEAMTKFGEGQADILLSTNIIESGIDIPSANTMIINRADMLGLSQLYQLRGRVGRGRQRAYAYLTTDPSRLLTPNAKRRLDVMQTLDSLGAGFSLASYDLDIRGAGNLLGDEQSGHVREVGVELYQEMLKEAVIAAKMGAEEEVVEEAWSPVINMGTAVLIPDNYVEDLTVRLSLYRRIAAMVDAEELNQLSAELVDRFGPIPDEVKNLLDTITIKILCRMANVAKVDAGPKGLSLAFKNNTFSNPDRLIGHIASKNGQLQLTGDHRLVIKRTLPLSQRAKVITEALQELVALTV